ncbi:hypothetical protein K438DRAFT_2093048 [Mycena galopus ATCC 62051]|nr:hypothetical protein K438DRAFT_2093048 [Mycena galopus ATCC 62051]
MSEITFTSPTKPDRTVVINHESPPTINAVRLAATSSLEAVSWDVAQWAEEPSTVHRPRIPESPAARKAVLRETLEQNEGLSRQILQNQTDIRQLKDSVLMLAKELSTVQSGLIQLTAKNLETSDVVELHECLDRCLQVTYILSPPPASLPPDIVALRIKALDILTKPQLQLCKFLHQRWKTARVDRNLQQHQWYQRRPDREMALERIKEAGLDSEGLKILHDFLETNPARLPAVRGRQDAADVHLRRLFAASGTYEKVAVFGGQLEEMRAGRAVIEGLRKTQTVVSIPNQLSSSWRSSVCDHADSRDVLVSHAQQWKRREQGQYKGYRGIGMLQSAESVRFRARVEFGA